MEFDFEAPYRKMSWEKYLIVTAGKEYTGVNLIRRGYYREGLPWLEDLRKDYRRILRIRKDPHVPKEVLKTRLGVIEAVISEVRLFEKRLQSEEKMYNKKLRLSIKGDNMELAKMESVKNLKNHIKKRRTSGKRFNIRLEELLNEAYQ